MDENNIDPEILRQINEALATMAGVSENLSEKFTKNNTLADSLSKNFTSLNTELTKLQALTKTYQSSVEKTNTSTTNATGSAGSFARAVSTLETSFGSLSVNTLKLQGAFESLTKTIDNINGKLGGGPPKPPGSGDNDGTGGSQNPIVIALYDLLGPNSAHNAYLDNIFGVMSNIEGVLDAFAQKLTDIDKIAGGSTVSPKSAFKDIQSVQNEIREELLKEKGIIQIGIDTFKDIEEIRNEEKNNLKKYIDNIEKQRKETLQAQQDAFSFEMKQQKLQEKQKEVFENRLKDLNKQLENFVTLTDDQYASLRNLNKQLIDKQKREMQLSDPESYYNELAEKHKGFSFSLGKYTSVVELAKSAMEGLVNGFKSMYKSLADGERGQLMAAKAVSAFTSSLATGLKTFGDAMAGVSVAMFILSKTPFGKLAAAGTALIAVISKVAGTATEVFNELNERAAKLNDDLYKGFTELSKASLSTGQGMTGLYDQLQKLGLQVSEAGKFIDLIKIAGKDLLMLGETGAKGIDKFVNTASNLLNSELGKTLEKMGITADDQREHVLQFLTQEARLGKLRGRTDEDLARSAGKYIKELDILAQLTGATRKEQEEARQAIMAIDELRAAQIAATNPEEQARLERAVKAAEAMYTSGAKNIATGIARYFAAGGVVDEYSASAFQAIPKTLENINKGLTSPIDNFKTGVNELYEQAKRFSAAGRLDAETLRSLTGERYATIADLQKRLEALMKAEEEAKKAGKEFNLQEYLEKQRIPLDKKTNEYVDTFVRTTRELAVKLDSLFFNFGKVVDVNKWAVNKFAEGVKYFEDALKRYFGTTEGEPSATTVDPNTGQPSATTTAGMEEEARRYEEAQRLEKMSQTQKELDELRTREKDRIRILEIERSKTEEKQNKREIERMEKHLALIRESIARKEESYKKQEQAHKQIEQAQAAAASSSGGTAAPSSGSWKPPPMPGAGGRGAPARSQSDEEAEGRTVEGNQRGAPNTTQGQARKLSEAIIFHHTGGSTVQGAWATLAQRNLSYHYIIDRDGTVHAYMPDNLIAHHAGESKIPDIGNNNTIGIAAVSPDDKSVTQKQMQAAMELSKKLAGKFGISKLYGHGQTSSNKMPDEGAALLYASETGRVREGAPEARYGAITNGPSSGYPVTHHGYEITAPLKPDSILEMMAKTAVNEVTNKPISGTLIDNDNNILVNKLTEYLSRQEQIIESMHSVFENMVDVLEESRDIQDDLLKHSRI